MQADGLWVFGQEALDLEVLLDPFEEQFYLPPPLIEIGDLRWGTLEVIGDERQFAALVFIEDFNSAPGFGRFSARLARQNDDFIGHDQAITVNGRALRIVSQIGFWPGHEIRFAGFDIGPELGLIPRPADKDS